MIFVVQTLIDAVSVGAIYALSALGIGLLFGIMRLINFAQSEFITVGVYVLMMSAGLWFPLAAFLAIGAVILLALALDRYAFRILRGKDPATLLITSFAVSYLLQNLLVLVFGARPIGFDILPQLSAPVVLGELSIQRVNIAIIAATAVLLAAVALILRFSRIGVEMRAAAVDFRMARLLGVRADRVIAVSFAMSGFLAAVVAVLYSAQAGIAAPTTGLQLALVGFVATVIGGMGSLVGAVAGGMAVGAAVVFLQAALPPELQVYREAFVYAIVILVLIFRPQGLFRTTAAKERV